MNNNEVWKDIKGYEGKYMVSNLGNVKALNYRLTRKEKLLTLQTDTKGYLRIQLYKNGKHETKKVHRLVAEAFIPNHNNLPQINHKDEHKTNNCVENLEWCTNKYNSKYGTKLERQRKSCSKTVYQYSFKGELIRVWSSTKECQIGGFNYRKVCDCCNNRVKTHKKFIWSYISLTKEEVIKKYNSLERKRRRIYQYDTNNNLVRIYFSLKECSDNGFQSWNIKNCCEGKRKTHKGYKWSYTFLNR